MARSRTGEDEEERPRPASTAPARCPSDGTALDLRGYCRQGGGFSVNTERQEACPHCRQRLGWAGDCSACHGSPTPGDRETWTFPGSRYELEAGHWRLVDPATNRPACSPEDNAAGMRALRACLPAAGDPEQAKRVRQWAAAIRVPGA